MTHSRYSGGLVRPVVATVAALAGCGGGGSDGMQSKTGTLRLGITDAPVDQADAVVVQFTGVELKPMGGAAFSRDFPTPKTLDLLALQGHHARPVARRRVRPRRSSTSGCGSRSTPIRPCAIRS